MPGAENPPLIAEPEFCVISRRHDSLGPRGRWRLFASLCAVSFGVALMGFAALGAWLVLPYSALEMAVLYLAFRCFERHAADWERVAVCGDRVIVESERGGVRDASANSTGTGCASSWRSRQLRPRAAADAAVRGTPGVRSATHLPAAERATIARELRRVLAKRSGGLKRASAQRLPLQHG